MRATKESLPFTVLARRAIEIDNGGHLVGTVYPGEKVNMEAFDIPDERWPNDKICKVEMALLWVYVTQGQTEFYNFCNGEQGEVEVFIAKNKDDVAKLVIPADLELAHKFLNDWFNDWSDADGTE